MLTGSSRDRGRICWYVVNGWDGLQLLPFTVGAVFIIGITSRTASAMQGVSGFIYSYSCDQLGK